MTKIKEKEMQTQRQHNDVIEEETETLNVKPPPCPLSRQ